MIRRRRRPLSLASSVVFYCCGCFPSSTAASLIRPEGPATAATSGGSGGGFEFVWSAVAVAGIAAHPEFDCFPLPLFSLPFNLDTRVIYETKNKKKKENRFIENNLRQPHLNMYTTDGGGSQDKNLVPSISQTTPVCLVMVHGELILNYNETEKKTELKNLASRRRWCFFWQFFCLDDTLKSIELKGASFCF